MDTLPPVITFEDVEKGSDRANGYAHRDYKILQKIANDTKFFNVIGLTLIPGFMLWTVRLEHEFYPPRTRKNKLYKFAAVNWEGMQYLVVSFPIEDRHKGEALAKSCNLRFADGVPTLIHAEGVKHFPMEGSNVWNVESLGDWTFNHEALMDLQQKEIDRIIADDEQLRIGKINVDL